MQKGLPSPDELFGQEVLQEIEALAPSEHEPIPSYRVVRRAIPWFIITAIILVIAFFWVNPMKLAYYYMESNSMQGEIPEGSLLIGKKTDVQLLQKGDVITFRNEAGVSVTHLIIEVIETGTKEEPRAFQTKGTENQMADQEIVTQQQILGKVVFHIPYIGKAFSAMSQMMNIN